MEQGHIYWLPPQQKESWREPHLYWPWLKLACPVINCLQLETFLSSAHGDRVARSGSLQLYASEDICIAKQRKMCCNELMRLLETRVRVCYVYTHTFTNVLCSGPLITNKAILKVVVLCLSLKPSNHKDQRQVKNPRSWLKKDKITNDRKKRKVQATKRVGEHGHCLTQRNRKKGKNKTKTNKNN